jgi:hypothetical protein
MTAPLAFTFNINGRVITKEDVIDIEKEGMTMHGDEATFTSSVLGSFNVTRAFAWACAHCEIVAAQSDLDDIEEMLARQDIDQEHLLRLRALSDAELLRRLLLFHCKVEHEGEERHVLLDGTHRLAEMARRARALGYMTIRFNTIEVTPAQLEPFRIRVFFRLCDGSRVELPPDEMLRAIEGLYFSPDGMIRDERATRG